ncbi:N-acetylglucosamine-6-phosphate deacetylase [Ruminococcaceae bacterium BL-4]|nr:N-acetylglucosamine-6-phosphate deacetylase [Ruminococcaceae bacterium BL-4]
MVLKNGEFFAEDFSIVKGDIEFQNGIITNIGKSLEGEQIDCSGCLIAPGFIDLHVHGCGGYDVCDKDSQSVTKMAHWLAQHGIVAFCPATMTMPHSSILNALQKIKKTMDLPQKEGAQILGAYLEGPFISAEKKGMQQEENIKRPNFSLFREYWESSGHSIRIACLAPEEPGAEQFAAFAQNFCSLSIAHSAADYEEAKEAFLWGIHHVTHLFNGMNEFHHRAPGVVGAVWDTPNITAELICDGIHIHPSVLRAAFRLLRKEQSCVISDSMCAAGMPDGTYEFGGQKVIVKEHKAVLSDGTLAGSVTNLLEEVQNLIRFGIPLSRIIRSVTLNPASVLGEDQKRGSIQIGKRADFTILKKAGFSLAYTICNGEIVARSFHI